MNLFQFIFLGFQEANKIKEKIANAPDDGYEIGVVIGTYLPFVLFVIFAYIVYFKARNRKD
jgi:hypothetical protein